MKEIRIPDNKKLIGRLSIMISKELHDQIKVRADEKGIQMSSLVRLWLTKCLKENQ